MGEEGKLKLRAPLCGSFCMCSGTELQMVNHPLRGPHSHPSKSPSLGHKRFSIPAVYIWTSNGKWSLRLIWLPIYRSLQMGKQYSVWQPKGDWQQESAHTWFAHALNKKGTAPWTAGWLWRLDKRLQHHKWHRKEYLMERKGWLLYFQQGKGCWFGRTSDQLNLLCQIPPFQIKGWQNT